VLVFVEERDVQDRVEPVGRKPGHQIDQGRGPTSFVGQIRGERQQIVERRDQHGGSLSPGVTRRIRGEINQHWIFLEAEFQPEQTEIEIPHFERAFSVHVALRQVK
jgi:hypothetical protein